jgi:hypothetical protein
MYRSPSTANNLGKLGPELYTTELRAANQDLESTTPTVSQTRETQCVSIPRTLRRKEGWKRGAAVAAPGKDKKQKPFGSSRHMIHHTGCYCSLLLLFGSRGQSSRATVARLACWGRRWGGAPCGGGAAAREIRWGRVVGTTGRQSGGRAGMRTPALPWIWDFGARGAVVVGARSGSGPAA